MLCPGDEEVDASLWLLAACKYSHVFVWWWACSVNVLIVEHPVFNVVLNVNVLMGVFPLVLFCVVVYFNPVLRWGINASRRCMGPHAASTCLYITVGSGCVMSSIHEGERDPHGWELMMWVNVGMCGNGAWFIFLGGKGGWNGGRKYFKVQYYIICKLIFAGFLWWFYAFCVSN